MVNLINTNRIKNIKGNAVNITAVNVEINRNKIEYCEIECITVHNFENSTEFCTFNDNRIRHLFNSLKYINSMCQMNSINYLNDCPCEITWLGEIKEVLYCKHNEFLIKYDDFLHKYGNTCPKFERLFDDVSSVKEVGSSLITNDTWIIIGAIAAVIIVFICCCCCCKC